MVKRNYFIGAAVIGAGVVAYAAVNRSTPEMPTLKEGGEKPNVIVVLLDDLGSTDVGFGGSQDIKTPNIDRIANEGMICNNAYISAPYSGPSRCGLNTGRYQQRFGAEGNTDNGVDAIAMKQGVLESEVLLSDVLKEQGYATCAIGKWHLGDNPDLWPQKRGFDYFYGFVGGGHNFWGTNSTKGGKAPYAYIQENGVEVKNTTYLTDDFTDKAVDFINKSSKEKNPFYIYLAYNAPHAPLQAPQRYLDRTAHISNANRSVYAAMILAVDDGIGKIWQTLEQNKVDDNTMIIFLSDNGGVGINGQSMNYPRRAFKGNMFDGGIRTPFAIYWKGRLHAGTTYDETISSLDIFPTVATAAGFDVSKNKNPLDGVDLMPYLTGRNTAAPHDKLYWRVCGGMEYAMRQGDYKLVKTFYDDEYQLYNLVKDPIEMTNIAAENKELVAQMAADYKKWDAQMMTPRWVDAHEPHQREDYKVWSNFRKRASGGRK